MEAKRFLFFLEVSESRRRFHAAPDNWHGLKSEQMMRASVTAARGNCDYVEVHAAAATGFPL
ncbi:MAG TPA: hypothetical protein VGD41_07225 [Pyrinomonadaceae bacterium]